MGRVRKPIKRLMRNFNLIDFHETLHIGRRINTIERFKNILILSGLQKKHDLED